MGAVTGFPAAAPFVVVEAGMKDKIVLITGGTSGIGLAAARLFLQRGALGQVHQPSPGEGSGRGSFGRTATVLRTAQIDSGAGRMLRPE